jgi:hypothetical protein
MSIQHADQYIVGLYDQSRSHWSTPESSYARRYLEFLTGKRREAPHASGFVRGPECIRERVARELAR